MGNKFTVPAEIREDAGKGASRRLRRTGQVPGILYGGGRDPVALVLNHNYLIHATEEEAFFSSVLEVKVGDGRVQKAVLRDLQRHPYRPLILHVDFQRVSDDAVLRMEVPVHFVNAEQSPAGKKAGVIISHQMTEIEIAALPKDLPEYIEVDLGNMKPGEAVMLSDLKLPEGVSIPALAVSEDNDAQVAAAIFIRESQGTGALAAEADAALAESIEPELADEERDEDADEGDAAEAEQPKGE